MEKYDVIVVGAGLIGSTMALLLAKHTKLNIALVERQESLNQPDHDNQRVVALGALATDILKDLGVFANLGCEYAHPYTSMHVWDENSPGELNFSASELDAGELGHMVDALACTHALQAQALGADPDKLTVKFGCDLQRLQSGLDGACLYSDQGTMRARLVIAADGAKSWLRGQAKIFANRHAYSQQGIVTKITTANSHSDCAWQRFLSSGPVAALPIHSNQSSIVWSVDDALASELMAMDDHDFALALTQAFDNKLGAVEQVTQRQSFPLISQKASAYYAPSVALIGDAAHSIHPLAGQGANLGFKDALCLQKAITACEVADDIGRLDFLQRYQQMRKPDNDQVDWLMSSLNTAFKVNWPLWLDLRGAGMQWINRQQGLKTVLASQAIGL